MGYQDDFLARVNVSGNSISESRTNITAKFIESTFADSPFYRIVKLNDTTDLEIQLQDISAITRSSAIALVQYMLKFMILKPYSSVNIGDMITMEDGTTWMVTDYTSQNPLEPKAKIEQCNFLLSVKTGQTEILVGYDNLKRPQYDIEPTTTDVHVILRNPIAIAAMNQSINLPIDNIYISMQYNDIAKLINENDEFIIYNKQYKVVGLDFTAVNYGVGVITFLTERVVNTQ